MIFVIGKIEWVFIYDHLGVHFFCFLSRLQKKDMEIVMVKLVYNLESIWTAYENLLLTSIKLSCEAGEHCERNILSPVHSGYQSRFIT